MKGRFTLNSYFSKNYYIAKDLNKLIQNGNKKDNPYVLSFVSANNLGILDQNKINSAKEIN